MAASQALSRFAFSLALGFTSVTAGAQVPLKSHGTDTAEPDQNMDPVSALTVRQNEILDIFQKLDNAGGFRFYEYAADHHGGFSSSRATPQPVPELAPEFYIEQGFIPNEKADAPPKFQITRLGEEGGILTSFLSKLGYSAAEIYNDIIPALKGHINPSRLSDRQEIEVTRTLDGEIKAIAFPDMDNPLKKTILDGQTFDVSIADVPYEKKSSLIRTDIESSFYQSMLEQGASNALISELIRLYSWDVNWQRDIRRGDEATILFTQPVLSDGRKLDRLPEVEYARLSVNGNPVEMYLFEGDYYKPDGSSIRKSLLRTPVDGARLSSAFNPKRLHPIYKTLRPHNGTDFAAPIGTAIYAAGDGEVIFAGQEPYDGNLIRIRHGNTPRGEIVTSYSHLSGFSRGLSKGQHVSQGDVIGYIGMTGTATGPHLHYAIKINGRFVDPMSLDLPTGRPLTGEKLEEFEQKKQSLQTQISRLMPEA